MAKLRGDKLIANLFTKRHYLSLFQNIFHQDKETRNLLHAYFVVLLQITSGQAANFNLDKAI